MDQFGPFQEKSTKNGVEFANSNWGQKESQEFVEKGA